MKTLKVAIAGVDDIRLTSVQAARRHLPVTDGVNASASCLSLRHAPQRTGDQGAVCFSPEVSSERLQHPTILTRISATENEWPDG